MKILKRLSCVLALVVAGGCSANVGENSASVLEGDGGVCEPELVTPMRTTDHPEVLEPAQMSMVTSEDSINLTFDAAEGFELGSMYVGVGVGIESLTWYYANPVPWADGYTTHAEIDIPLADLAFACGSEFKLVVQGYARHTDVWESIFISAVQSQDGGVGGWYDFHNVCCEVPESGCTLTQGYWKNHRRSWPVSSVTLGAEDYSTEEAQDLLRTRPRGDASVILAHQLIAALLNGAAGASGIAEIAAAQDWIAANGARLPFDIAPSSEAGAEAVALADALADYNEGATGPGHCGD